jgi:hypothetical protein
VLLVLSSEGDASEAISMEGDLLKPSY